ncbi:MAG: precorrin-6A reductase [Hungatella sp.]|nr:precorrin-6A reductase [Hungatella sp.]
MCKVIIFGGTTEGRRLAEYCGNHEIPALVSVVSDYGAELVKENSWVNLCRGAKSREEMEELLAFKQPSLVVDASHPYAAAVTKNIQEACSRQGVDYLRVARESQEGRGQILWVLSAGEAADYLSCAEGNILLTTGSRELEAFSHIRNFKERVFARVLPDQGALAACEKAGLAGRQIIAMQGPFSVEMNLALLAMTGARYLVTKESGAAGGFQEKIEAAHKAGVKVVAIGRPVKPEGVTAEEAMNRLKPYGKSTRCRVWLAGIGMGGPGQMTMEVLKCLEKAQAVAGAKRMMESVGPWCSRKETLISYKPEEILCWLEANPHIQEAVVVFSGDTGFYSGARAMEELLAKHPHRYETRMLPGISTLSFLCARLKTTWENVYPASLHGRPADPAALLRDHGRVFFLMGDRKSMEELCRRLKEAGAAGVRISAGAWLSYPQERIIQGSVEEVEAAFQGADEGTLWAVLAENI